jgi:hypothetical protein
MEETMKPLVVLLVAAAFLFAPRLMAQDHPQEHPKKTEQKKEERPKEHLKGKKEHPQGEPPKEHPQESKEHPKEHPKDEAAATTLTLPQLADAVRAYVAKESKASKGKFMVMDDVAKKNLALKFVKVHEERLAHLGENVYFVCADFKGGDGKVYDVDIFMKGTNKDDLVSTERIVHKVSGKPRYNWYEESGIWKKKPVDAQ